MLPIFAYANLFWCKFNLLPIPPLDGGQAVRSFLRIFLREATSFRIAVWIAIVAGIATVAYAISQRSLIMAVLIGWYVYMNYQQWQHFREHGTPGD